MPRVGDIVDLAVTPNGQVPSTRSVRTPTPKHPRLVNRGAAGLLHKTGPGKTGPSIAEGLVPGAIPDKAELTQVRAKYQIAPAIMSMAVPIESVVSDPNNANSHPDRNIDSIRQSLLTYGQVKPIVVRSATRVVVAGNGTLEVAKALGWTQIAAAFIDMNEVEAIGYGIADNRTANLAKWNFEVLARLDKLLLEAGHPTIGWSTDELSVLRSAEWTPPTVEGGGFGGEGGGASDPLLVSFTPDQYEVVKDAIGRVREALSEPEMDQATALYRICRFAIIGGIGSWLKGAKEHEAKMDYLRGISDAKDR
jgi:hypothetical protein